MSVPCHMKYMITSSIPVGIIKIPIRPMLIPSIIFFNRLPSRVSFFYRYYIESLTHKGKTDIDMCDILNGRGDSFVRSVIFRSIVNAP